MKKFAIRRSMSLVGLLLCAASVCTAASARGEVAPEWDQVSASWQCPEWFKDAKFGLWLHWGPQTIPAKGGGWYARDMYMEKDPESWGKDAWSYHRETYGPQSKFGYKDLCNSWKAEKFDADVTIKQFKNWGARYVVTMANHHDNFDLFASSVHGWNTTKVGPKRDLVGEFAAAARRHDLKWAAAVYCSRAPDWFTPAFGSDADGPLKGVPYDGNQTKADGKGLWWEGLDPQQLYASKYPNFNQEFGQRIFELVTNYRPDELYFDDGQVPGPTKPACAALYANSLKNNGSIQAVVTVKSPEAGTILDFEKGVSEGIQKDYWQTDITLAEDWFLKPNPDGSSNLRHNARSLKERLVDTVSKRGVLLLCVAIRADGTIPADQTIILDELGLWLKGNGEAIYNTHPWKVCGEGGEAADGDFDERGITSKPWDSSVLRFTVNKLNTTLYVHVFGDPTAMDLIVQSMAADKQLFTGKIRRVSVIGSHARVKWSMQSNGLHIKIPSKLGFNDCNVLKIETTGL